jgi:hypothetical protein
MIKEVYSNPTFDVSSISLAGKTGIMNWIISL